MEPSTGDQQTASDEETRSERLNRELDQLLNELRVVLPGVQVLLAFLLTAPFTVRFHDLPASARNVYFGGVTLVAVASVLLMAPAVHHRLRFRRGTKEEMIRTANGLALGGMVCLGLGLGSAVYVAGEAAFPGAWVRWVGPAVVVAAFVVWFVLPFRYRTRRPPADEQDA
ncbi:MAG: hypothetical protein JWO77_2579 [Ilumatobacteraceae bacterium]|nr:hypothetical protein [Ilumatobacteraceae bacterium]